MKAEREREAADERARGNEAAQRLRAQADRTAIEIVSEAERDARSSAARPTPSATRILAEAYGADEEFFAFLRSMRPTGTSLTGENATLMIEPDSAFFDYLHSPDAGAAPAAPRGGRRPRATARRRRRARSAGLD